MASKILDTTIACRVPDSTKNELIRISRAEQVHPSALMRQAVKEYLERRPPPVKRAKRTAAVSVAESQA